MDVFKFRDRVIGDYGNYVRSFLTIKDERIDRLVREEMDGHSGRPGSRGRISRFVGSEEPK